MSACGFRWNAPRVPTPDAPAGHLVQYGAHDITVTNPTSVPQVCVLPAGHEGPHQSATKVTTL